MRRPRRRRSSRRPRPPKRLLSYRSQRRSPHRRSSSPWSSPRPSCSLSLRSLPSRQRSLPPSFQRPPPFPHPRKSRFRRSSQSSPHSQHPCFRCHSPYSRCHCPASRSTHKRRATQRKRTGPSSDVARCSCPSKSHHLSRMDHPTPWGSSHCRLETALRLKPREAQRHGATPEKRRLDISRVPIDGSGRSAPVPFAQGSSRTTR
jgi:hypothetical protein